MSWVRSVTQTLQKNLGSVNPLTIIVWSASHSVQYHLLLSRFLRSFTRALVIKRSNITLAFSPVS